MIIASKKIDDELEGQSPGHDCIPSSSSAQTEAA
jgi:hypothetical protein